MPHIVPSHTCKFIFFVCLLCVTGTLNGLAQTQPDSSVTSNPPPTFRPDSLLSDSAQVDSLRLSGADSFRERPESGEPGNAPSVPDAIQYQSNDSLIVDFRSGRTATLYGAAKVSHTSGELTSGEIEMDLKTSTVEAKSSEAESDTLSMPVLTRDGEEIRSRRILFNYQTQKGKFEEARINVGEGQLIGSKVKNVSETEVFIENGIYSTCAPEYLYYYIKAQKMKVVDQDEIFFTNARLYILDIPYPLVFPFGYVPSGGLEQKKSGLLTPTYVFDAQADYGIGLNNVGWFQYINDYITTTIDADIYTSGTMNVSNNTQYRKGSQFNGSFSWGYSRRQGLEPTDPGYTKTINKSIGLNHSQTISPYANVSANINIRTADYIKETSVNIEDRSQTNSVSRAAYKYNHPDKLFNFSSSASLTQDFSVNTTSLSGPGATFSLKTLTPLQNNKNNSDKWYESLTIRYNSKLNTQFTYNPIDDDSAEVSFLDALTNRSLYEEATGNDDYIEAGMQHTASVTLGRLLNNPYINTSASINFNEYWYPTSTRRTFNSETNSVEEDRIPGFASARDFSTSLSFSTTVYGMSNAKIGKMEGFRHTLIPNMSLSYRPDFSDDIWGFYRTVQRDTLGNTLRYSIFGNELYGGPSAGESRSISFGIQNVFETKIIDRDSTGEKKERTLKLIDRLSLNSSYNFAADSLNLAPLSAQMNISAIKGLSMNANATFSFYERNDNGSQYNQYLWENGKLAQLDRFSISATSSFKGGRKGPEPYTPIYRKKYDPLNQGIFSTIDPGYGYEPVAPFNSTWSFSLSFRYSWQYRHNAKPTRSATLNANSISFNLTPKWRFRTQLGYDFIQQKLTPSQFNLDRNLECWDLSFQIRPFGENQYYFFSLRLNSSQIQSLFQKLPILKNLERRSDGATFGNTGSRY